MSTLWWSLVTVLALLITFWICIADETNRNCSEPCVCCANGICNDRNKCDGCKDGFTGQTCMEPCHAHCKSCSQTSLETGKWHCFVCIDGYYIEQDNDSDPRPLQKDCTLPCKQDCKICSSYSSCTECKTGHFLDASNDCMRCPDHCQICSTETDCVKCDKKYFWDGSACRHCISPCESCSSSLECDSCPVGHLLFKGGCLECAKPCRSCKAITGQKQACNDCAEGYYLIGHECLKCSEHCTSCLNDTNCQTCETKYKPHKGKCFLCETPCTSCSSHSICTSCQERYFNLHQKCIQYPMSCFSCRTGIKFKANASSFLPANNSFMCSDKTGFCKDMYKIENCEAYSADCLQEMCKLIDGVCRNTSFGEDTTNSTNRGAKTEDRVGTTIAVSVLCGTMGFFILGLLAFIFRTKVIKQKQQNADVLENDIGESVPEENVALLSTKSNSEIHEKKETLLSEATNNSQKQEDGQTQKEDTSGDSLKDDEGTTVVDNETTVSKYLKSKSQSKILTSNSFQRLIFPRSIEKLITDFESARREVSQLERGIAAYEIWERLCLQCPRYQQDIQKVLQKYVTSIWKEKNLFEAVVAIETKKPLADACTTKRDGNGDCTGKTTNDDVDRYVEKLTETEFSESLCSEVLDSVRRNTISLETLTYFGNQIKEKVPKFPEEKPTVQLDILNEYGKGYTSFIPDEILKTCEVYQVSGKDNSCLFNAVSVALYGDESKASMLKLLTATLGAVLVDDIINKLMCCITTKDQVRLWAAEFLADDKQRRLTGSPREMMEKIVNDELMCTIDNSDSGAVQLEILARITGRQIKVYQINIKERYFGVCEDMTLKLVYVPLHNKNSKTDVSFNHFVPAIETKKEMVCLAESVGFCQGQHDKWVECRKCHRMFHFYCVYADDRDAPDIDDCGCTKIRPFVRKRSGVLFSDEENVHKTLEELQGLLKSLCNDLTKPDDQARFPSWRKSKISTGQTKPMESLFAVDENVIKKIKKFVEQTLDEHVQEIFMHGVLVPEVLVLLIMKVEQCNRLEAECILNDCQEGAEDYMEKEYSRT